MRIKFETTPKTPEAIEHAKHYSTLSVGSGHLILTVLRRPWTWWPKCWPFDLAARAKEVSCIALPVRATQADLNTLLSQCNALYASTQQSTPLEHYARLIKQSKHTHGLNLSVSGFKGALVLVLLLWVITALLSPHSDTNKTAQTGNTQTAAALPDSPIDTLSSIPAVMKSAHLPALSLKQALEIVTHSGGAIELRKASQNAKTLVLFLDPLCTHCRDFEKTVTALPKQLGLLVVPVAYQKGAKPYVAHTLCSPPHEQASVWRQMMSADIMRLQPSSACDKGNQLADENSVVFARAGMQSTPSIILQETGERYTSKDFSTDAVAAWAKS